MDQQIIRIPFHCMRYLLLLKDGGFIVKGIKKKCLILSICKVYNKGDVETFQHLR